jgi:ABC-type uncharacterized transport system auxiliary subunit
MASASLVREALALVAVCVTAGCVSKPPLDVQAYTIDPPPDRAAVDRTGAVIVSLARVRVVPPYGGTSFVYRLGEHRVERDPYAIFAAPPGWMLTSAIRGYLRNADFIRDVVEPGGEVAVVAVIESEVNELCADLPDGGEATAILTLQFRVYAPASGAMLEKELFRKMYSRRRPLAARDADAFVDAWNQELSEIADEFLSDLRPVLKPAP